MTRRWLTVLGGLATLLVVPLAAACGGGDNYADSIPAATTRTVQITAFEIKGSTHASELAPPSVDPSGLSDGYGFKDVGVYEADSDKWQVASYMWSPGEVTAFQGDTLNLNIFVLNGNKHETWIEGPDGETVVDEFEMNRGREYQVSVRVTKPGVYRLICNTHEPTMTAEIVVLPRPSS
jgi:plastocyanin